MISALGSRTTFAFAVCVAIALRVAHLRAFQHSPLADNPVLDNQAYDRWAQQIAAGDWLSRTRGVFWVDPLYPYVLAVLFSLFGRRLVMVRALQCALGVINVFLTRTLARKISGSAAMAHIAALLSALYLPAIHNEMQTEKSALTTTLFTAALVYFLDGSSTKLVTSGVLLGAAVLSRGNLLVMIPAGALCLLFTRRPPSPPSPDGSPTDPPDARPRVTFGPFTVDRAAVINALRFAGAALAVVSVVTVRNVYVAHDLVPTTGNGGQNFYIGQFSGNTSGAYTPPPFVRPDPDHEEMDFRAEAERRTGHAMRASEVTTYWAREAVGAMLDDPGTALTRSLRKLRLTFHEFETPDADDVDVVADYSWVLRLPFVWMGQIAPFAFLGAWVSWRRSWDARVVISATGIYVVTLVMFFVLARFRLPITPCLLALAPVGGAWLLDRLRAWDLERGMVGLATVGLLGFVFIERPDWMEDLRRSSLAVAYNNLGAQAMQSGDDVTAMASYERAVETSPSSVVGAMRTLGDLYLRHRDYDAAERMMQRVMENRPNSPLGRQALVRLYEAMAADPRYAHDTGVRQRLADTYRAAGRTSDAERVGAEIHGSAQTSRTATERSLGTTDLARARDARARALEAARAGRWTEAIEAYQEAVRVGPYNEDWRYSLGGMMANHASPEEMVRYYTAAVATDPKPQTSLYFWALGLEREGNIAGALRKLDEVLAVDPAHEMSELRECVLYERQGELTRAMTHCDLAVQIFPDFRAAHEERARILRAEGHGTQATDEDAVAARSDPNTPRRFVYWGRYLIRVGRYAAAIPELQHALDQDAHDAEALRWMAIARAHATDARAATDAGAGVATSPEVPTVGGLDAQQRAEIRRVLETHPPGAPVWFAAYPLDPAAMARVHALAEVFTQAGWSVRGIQSADVRLRPGVTLYGAEANVPGYVATVQSALQAAGFSTGINGGYRAYYEEAMRTRPGFHGFAFAPDQTYLLVVGPPG